MVEACGYLFVYVEEIAVAPRLAAVIIATRAAIVAHRQRERTRRRISRALRHLSTLSLSS